VLERIAEEGLLEAIARGTFGETARREDEGRGIAGIVETGEGYFNPLVELMRPSRDGAPQPGGHPPAPAVRAGHA
jgi:hypothetical protein